MAVTAGMLARAAATALSNEKLRKGIGWVLVAVLSPVILLIAVLCSIGTGGAEHNNYTVSACFYGPSYSEEVPAEFQTHITEMRSAFSLLDSAVAVVNVSAEDGSLDPTRPFSWLSALARMRPADEPQTVMWSVSTGQKQGLAP